MLGFASRACLFSFINCLHVDLLIVFSFLMCLFAFFKISLFLFFMLFQIVGFFYYMTSHILQNIVLDIQEGWVGVQVLCLFDVYKSF